jgi:hypothetical protein
MTSSTPNNPTSASTSVSKDPVKIANPDIIIFNDEAVPIEIMTDLIFEDIGGQELINIARNDTVNGSNIVYQPIANISLIASRYNSQNIIPIQNTSNFYFENFAIKLENYLPTVGTGPNGEQAYVDENGDLVVNVVNTPNGEQVEIQILNSGDLFDDTIY